MGETQKQLSVFAPNIQVFVFTQGGRGLKTGLSFFFFLFLNYERTLASHFRNSGNNKSPPAWCENFSCNSSSASATSLKIRIDLQRFFEYYLRFSKSQCYYPKNKSNQQQPHLNHHDPKHAGLSVSHELFIGPLENKHLLLMLQWIPGLLHTSSRTQTPRESFWQTHSHFIQNHLFNIWSYPRSQCLFRIVMISTYICIIFTKPAQKAQKMNASGSGDFQCLMGLRLK